MSSQQELEVIAGKGDAMPPTATALRRPVDDLLLKATQHNRSDTELRLQKQLAEDVL